MCYKLKLLDHARLHLVSHVSLLKKKTRSNVEAIDVLLVVQANGGNILPKPQAILDRRMKEKKKSWFIGKVYH